MSARKERRAGIVALVLYALCIVAANWFIQHVGQQSFPGGPHTIPVGFGYRAPSGVLWIGLAFTVRDVVQSTLGKRAVLAAILAGAVLSYAVAPSLAWASGAAFLLGELCDFAVYVPLVERGRVVLAVAASNAVGLVIDTFVFLWLAFHSLQFWQGQVIGKAEMTVLALLVLVPWRRRVLRVA